MGFGPARPESLYMPSNQGESSGAGWGAGLGGLLAGLMAIPTGGLTLATMPAFMGATTLGSMGGGLLGRAGGSIYDAYNPQEIDMAQMGGQQGQYEQPNPYTPFNAPMPSQFQYISSPQVSQSSPMGGYGGQMGGYGGQMGMFPPAPMMYGPQQGMPGQPQGFMPIPSMYA
jgi:hypothetical protein